MSDRHDLELARGALLLVALSAAGAVAGSSCLLSGYDKTEGEGGAASSSASTSGSSVTAASSTSSGEGGNQLPLCDTTTEPPPPENTSDIVTAERWFALRSLRFGDPSDPESVPGFDLDDADGCRTDCRGANECAVPSYLDLTQEDRDRLCDFHDGIDNSAAHLFQELVTELGASEDDLTAQAEVGDWSLLFRIRAWNGMADDEQVEVALFSTPGFAFGFDGGGGAGGVMEPPEPIWNGSDVWPIDLRSLDVAVPDLEHPSFDHKLAYVADGMVVASLGGTFYAGTNKIPIQLANGVLVAPVKELPVRLENATFGGRWPVQDLIDGIGELVVKGTPVCFLGPIFEPQMAQVCKLVDVTETGNAGGCDALSFGFAFDAYEIRPGEIVNPATAPAGCPALSCEDLFPQP